LPDFNETLIFLIYFQKNAQISNFIEIRLVEAELFQAEGQTDRQRDRETDIKKLTDTFCNFANATKRWGISLLAEQLFVSVCASVSACPTIPTPEIIDR
jgi:hypothetical protein